MIELDSAHAGAIGLLGLCYKDGLGLERCKRTALGLLEKAMKINEAVLGPHHPHTAESLNNLATLHQAMGNHKAALPLLTRALEIREAVLGPRHPDTAESLNNLATLHQYMGNHKAALPLFTRALEIREAVLGPRHPTTESILMNLVVLQKHLGKKNEVDGTGIPRANEKRDESGPVVTVDKLSMLLQQPTAHEQAC